MRVAADAPVHRSPQENVLAVGNRDWALGIVDFSRWILHRDTHVRERHQYATPEVRQLLRRAQRKQVVAVHQRTCDCQAQCAWLVSRVGISEEQPVAVGHHRAGVQGVRFARPALRQPLDTHHLEPCAIGMRVLHLQQDVRGGVFRCVVDHDDAEVRVILCQ